MFYNHRTCSMVHRTSSVGHRTSSVRPSVLIQGWTWLGVARCNTISICGWRMVDSLHLYFNLTRWTHTSRQMKFRTFMTGLHVILVVELRTCVICDRLHQLRQQITQIQTAFIVVIEKVFLIVVQNSDFLAGVFWVGMLLWRRRNDTTAYVCNDGCIVSIDSINILLVFVL